MTVSVTTNKVIGQGNGATTVFSFNFLIQDASELSVTYTDANGNSTPLAASLYSVSGVNNPSGGTVTYPLVGSPIATGTQLTIIRSITLQQLTSLINQGSYNPAVVEAALDYLMMAVQQVNELHGRGLAVPATDVNPTVTLPPAIQRKNLVLGFDANGNPTLVAAPGNLTVSGFMTTFLQLATAAAACADLGLAPRAGTKRTAQMNVADNSNTMIDWTAGTSEFDDDGLWVAGSPTRFTIVNSGRYRIQLSANFNTGLAGTFGAWVMVNGSIINELNVRAGLAAMTTIAGQNLQAGATLTLTAGQYLQLTVFQKTGGTLTPNQFTLSVERVK